MRIEFYKWGVKVEGSSDMGLALFIISLVLILSVASC
jgi:hypothetical protein